MKQGPIKDGERLHCTGCEFSNRKQVSRVLIGGGSHSGTVYHCLHEKSNRGELWIEDRTPSWCPYYPHKTNEK